MLECRQLAYVAREVTEQIMEMLPELLTNGVIGLLLGASLTFALFQSRMATQQKLLTEREAELKLTKNQHDNLQEELLRLRQALEEVTADKVRAETLLNEAKEQEARIEAMGQKSLKQIKQELEDEVARDQQTRQELFQQRMTELLKPIQTLIQENEKKVREVEKQHLEESASLKKHIELLVDQTGRLAEERSRLADALSNSKGRGDWGEMELVRLLEESGLMPQVHYEAQKSVQDGQELLRPDITIKLPNQRVLYVDAKTIMVSLERLEHTIHAEGESVERKKHAAALEKEILSLNMKSYESKTTGSIDFVILYVPRESMLRVALEERPALMEMAFRKRIILASPLVLMSILKTVAYGWQQAQISQNAQAVHEMGKEIHKRASIFLDRFLKLGDRIESLTNLFEETRTALCGRVGLMYHLRKLEDHGCKSEKELPELPMLETFEELQELDERLPSASLK